MSSFPTLVATFKGPHAHAVFQSAVAHELISNRAKLALEDAD